MTLPPAPNSKQPSLFQSNEITNNILQPTLSPLEPISPGFPGAPCNKIRLSVEELSIITVNNKAHAFAIILVTWGKFISSSVPQISESCLLSNINNSRKKWICCNPGSILNGFFPRHQPYFETTGNLTHLFSGRTFLSWFSLRDTESEFSTTLQWVGRKTLPNNHKSCFLFRAQVFCYTTAGLDDLSLSYCCRSFLERHIRLFRKDCLIKLHTV